jgi:gamma-glutamyl hercynylcysteine S-oxide synthase
MADQLTPWVEDARERTLAIAEGLLPGELLGPRLSIVNPPLWELGHVGWFQELWVLRRAAGRAPLRADGDGLYDSAAIPHDTRWDLPLPSLEETLDYLTAVRDAVRELLVRDAGDGYFVRLSIFHEDMHAEAMAFTRQTLGARRPPLASRLVESGSGGPLPGDVQVPGGTFVLGSLPGSPFVFDNEKWAHPVTLQPFAIARAPVTQSEYLAFVDDRGYQREDLWSPDGWSWRAAVAAEYPLHWRREGQTWLRRDFQRWVPLEPHRPVVHVSWHEANAFCRWAGRRLPTEAEWEAAAAGEPGPDGRLAPTKRRYPWGDAPPTAERAQLEFRQLACGDVAALPEGDSAFGCRQMLGNVWEWTASDFLPYPGFAPDPYQEYSLPWFGNHKVLRGGSFATTARLIHAGFRNFYTPDRRDQWAGFRTCVL